MKLASLLFSLVISTKAVELAYYEGRSGNIILQPENVQEGSFLMLNSPFDGEDTQNLAIPETSIADLVSHFVGGPVVSSEASRNLLSDSSLNIPSVFNKAKANLMFVLNDAEELPQLKSTQSGRRMDITRLSYPQDFTASLATLSTGASPSTHGIVADSWTNNYEEIKPTQTGAIVDNLYDVMSRGFGSHSLLFSVSADQQTAWITAPHFENPAQTSHNHAYYFNAEKGTVQNMGNSQGLALTRSNIIDNFRRRMSTIEGLSFQGGQMTANIQGVQATFDPTRKADLQFYAEVEMVYSVLDQLNSDSFAHLVSDEVPDFFTFSFVSLRSLALKYGRTGANYKAAQYILDEVVSQATASFQKMYAGKLVVETVFAKLPSSMELALDSKTMDSVYDSVRKSLDGSKTSFMNHYPTIYLRDGVNSETLCSELKGSVTMKVNCPEPLDFVSFDDWVIRETATNGTTGFTSTEAYQITLWSSIILVVALILTLCALFNMDVGNDSMLYRGGGGKGVPTI